MPSARANARPRRRWLLVIGAVAILAAAGLAVGAIALTLSIREDEPKARVLLVGDSIMKQTGAFVDEALAEQGLGDVEVVNAGVNGSGLLTPRVYDWQSEAEQLIEDEDPDVVVVLFIGNYTDDEFYVNERGEVVEAYTDRFFEAWGVEADRLMEILTSGGAQVYWVHSPPLPVPEGEHIVSELRQVHEGIASRWPGTALIDGTTALADDKGHYARELPVGENGEMVAVRTDEGVHLTEAGSKVMAETIAAAIAPAVREAVEEPA